MNLAGTLGRLLLGNALSGDRESSGLGVLLGDTQVKGAAPATLLSRFSSDSSNPDTALGRSDGSLGDLLTLALQESGVDGTADTGTQPVTAPTAAQTDEAALMIRAMLNAAKCDGRVDESEMASILKHIEDLGEEEQVFISREIRKPADLDTFIRTVPRGMERSVYLMSLLAITIDTAAEARYLRELAQGLELTQEEVNALHVQVGATPVETG